MIYLDCNATTPVEPTVQQICIDYLAKEYGNAGSRTHEFGSRAKAAVIQARSHVAELLGVDADGVVFTSGATESNNLAILGLVAGLAKSGQQGHLITSAQEHKAVLEPFQHLQSLGFEVTYLNPGQDGILSADDLRAALRMDTILVSLMHVNNETGIIQPLDEYSKVMEGHRAYLHVDAAQSYGKLISELRHPRVDLISASGHKIYGPKGIGILAVRERDYVPPPIKPLMFGGGQEKGLRPGTLPVHLIAGIGEASRLALRDHSKRAKACEAFRRSAVDALVAAGGVANGDERHCLPSTLNIAFPGADSEALILALKDFVAVSNGSACTSSSYTFSHVLTAMCLPKERIKGALRLSWCHMTPEVDWAGVQARLKVLLNK
jgi:cysteine desulfurase